MPSARHQQQRHAQVARQQRDSQARAAMWMMPVYDPVLALGPFLQLPAYLPSGQESNASCSQWYGNAVIQNPREVGILNDNLDMDSASCQMSAQAPSFVPASRHGHYTAVTPSPTDSARSSSSEALVRAAASNMTVSTSVGSSSDSAQDDASQDVDAMVSARSEVTSSDAPCSTPHQNSEPTQKENFWIPTLKPLPNFTQSVHDGRPTIIDPEAANPTPEDIAMISKCQVASQHTRPQSKTSPTTVEATSPSPSLPGLDVVLGCWWDSKNSLYEVTFDENTIASCHVKTTRPGGVIRETSALIRVGQTRGKSAGRIIWGSAFVLELPVVNPDQLEWRSIRGGRDFSWTRCVEEQDKPLELVLEPHHDMVALELHAQLDSGVVDTEPEEPQFTCDSDSRSAWKSSTHRRVWRAVQSGDETVEAPRTPSEVASAPTRRVQARSGEWRVIDKKPLKK